MEGLNRVCALTEILFDRFEAEAAGHLPKAAQL
jgi:hypothetical protein